MKEIMKSGACAEGAISNAFRRQSPTGLAPSKPQA
jgi:hypothetical protein